MGNAQHKGRIVEGLLGQQGQGFRFNLQDLLAFKFGHGNMFFAQQIVFGLIFCQRKGFLINKRFSRHSFAP
jgi:hypothetical protein